MTTFRITPSTSVFTNLDYDHAFEGDSAGADQLIVDPGAFLITSGRYADAALLAPTGAWNVTVEGAVVSDDYYGLVLDAGNAAASTITIGEEAEVSGYLAGLSLRSAATVTNHGLIGTSEIGPGIALNGAGSHTVINTGTIGSSIVDYDGLSADQVTNSGAIAGHVSLGGGDDRLTNTGQVARGVNLGDGRDTLTNAGEIGGGPLSVFLGAGSDVFTNYATVNGTVVSGTVSAWINLGDGDDRLYGGANTEIVQDAGGADRVSLGGGDDLYIATGAFGGDGIDKISGGSGSDTNDASSYFASVSINLDTVAHDLSPLAPGFGRIAAGTANGTAVGSDKISGFENAKGGDMPDTLHGSGAANVLEGADGTDDLFGYAGNDTLNGGESFDRLLGGAGRDVLIGGLGSDAFIFTSTGDSGRTNASRDLIADFEDMQDLISLDLMDAVAGTAANDAFTFIGSNVAFGGHAGELRSHYTAKGQVVEGDVNGDGVGDFSIALQDAAHSIVLTEADFVL